MKRNKATIATAVTFAVASVVHCYLVVLLFLEAIHCAHAVAYVSKSLYYECLCVTMLFADTQGGCRCLRKDLSSPNISTHAYKYACT